MAERSSYIWNAAPDGAGRRAKRDQLVGIGCTEVLIKGFGDDGVVWIEGVALPSFARSQWSDAYAADYAPLTVTLWGYPWPRDSDLDGCVQALMARWSPRVVLNPETEWRYQNSNVNPWNSLAEANAAAQDWMRRLKAACQSRFGRVPSFWISSCPSWSDFPYEGFMAECDGALPEHYFPDSMMARGENMVEAHIRRAGTAKPCVPVVTACREYDDQGVIDLAHSALLALPQPAGFSAWEAGNTAFQSEAMRQVYALLPEDQVVAEVVVPNSYQYGPYGKHLGGGFRKTYEDAGANGLALYGFPVTNEITENGITVQYFERARFEYHPDSGQITFGRVGAELARLRGLSEAA